MRRLMLADLFVSVSQSFVLRLKILDESILLVKVFTVKPLVGLSSRDSLAHIVDALKWILIEVID